MTTTAVDPAAPDPYHRRDLSADLYVVGIRGQVQLSESSHRDSYFGTSSFVFTPATARRLAVHLLEMADLLEPSPDVLEPPEGDGETTGYEPAALQR